MKTNMGTIDRVLRLVVGLVLLYLAFTGAIGLWGYIGIVPVVTALVGFCPLYRIIGIQTCGTGAGKA